MLGLCGLAFLISLIYCVKSCCTREQLTNLEIQNQRTETIIEMTEIDPISEVIDENQQALADLEKEITVLKKQKEKAQLVKEIKALERESELHQAIVASTSLA